MGPDRRPEFIPPAYLDPDQKPRRNLLHKTHPDLLDGIVPSQRNPRHVAPRNPAYPTSGDTPPAANAGEEKPTGKEPPGENPATEEPAGNEPRDARPPDHPSGDPPQRDHPQRDHPPDTTP